jgi:hypothetical protein
MGFLGLSVFVEPPQAITERAAQHLVGVMDTSASAAGNAKVANVIMTTCRIQVKDLVAQPGSKQAGSTSSTTEAASQAIYLYQEQALAQELHKPYRQRILELSYRPFSQTVRSRSFKLRQPNAQINFCDRDDRVLQLSDFPEVVCSVFLKENSQGFSGTTPANGCPTQARGAAFIRNRIDLHGLGMDTWDRGFDVKGQQIWGAKTEAYKFRWKRKG